MISDDDFAAILDAAEPDGGTPRKGDPGYEEWREAGRRRPPADFPDGPEWADRRRSDMERWFPVVMHAGILVPRTVAVPVRHDTACMMDAETPHGWDDLVRRMRNIRQDVFGGRCFLRASHTSGKHEWRHTCANPDIGEGAARICCACLMAMPVLPVRHFYLREWIRTAKPVYVAEDGLPVTREFRLFVHYARGVEHVQPYWPPDFDGTLHPEIETISTLTRDELGFLSMQARIAAQALSDANPDDDSYRRPWSADFLQAADGRWHLIDMAAAALSFRWTPDFPVVVG